MLPSLPLAAGKVEIRVERPALDVPALAEERKAVRLEELAQVALRQEPGVPGVAGALEAVERERLQRVGGRDLVDDEDAAAVPNHADELGQQTFGPGDVMERAERAAEVELAVAERKRQCVGLDEARVRRGSSPSLLEQLLDAIDADDLANVRRERDRERSCAAAEVDRPLVAAGEHERVHALCELLGARVLQGGERVGGSSEAVVSHRRRLAAHAPGPTRCR